jgi:Uma2 family endonuclease
MLTKVNRKYFTTDEYHRMVAQDILSAQDRIELIEGEVLFMSPIGSRHAACVNRLTAILSAFLKNQEIVSIQNPIQLSQFSEPEPDVALLRPRDDFYASHLPTPADILLIIEVADTSIEYDQQTKLPLYARSAIHEVWIVNLNSNSITTYTNPSVGEYQVVKQYSAVDTIQSATISQLQLQAKDIIV